MAFLLQYSHSKGYPSYSLQFHLLTFVTWLWLKFPMVAPLLLQCAQVVISLETTPSIGLEKLETSLTSYLI